MALPATGDTYANIFSPGLNPLGVRKGVITDVFIRDYHQSSTSLADAAVGLGADGYFSPYAQDGQVRTDLLRTATGTNLGFYHIGLLGSDGIGYDPNTSMEEVPTAQSLRPARVDITKEGETFDLTCLEMTPLVRFIANEMPLINVPDVGTANLTIAKPMEATIVERQAILWGFDGQNYFSRTIPRCAKTKEAPFKWAREGKQGTGVKLTFAILPCPYVAKPVLEHYEGAAWRALGGYALFPAPAPVATAVAGAKATVVFSEATGNADPFTYVVEKAPSPAATPWTTATIDAGYPSTVGTDVTIRVTGITADEDWIFRVKATGTNLLETTSLVSNEITGLT